MQSFLEYWRIHKDKPLDAGGNWNPVRSLSIASAGLLEIGILPAMKPVRL